MKNKKIYIYFINYFRYFIFNYLIKNGNIKNQMRYW